METGLIKKQILQQCQVICVSGIYEGVWVATFFNKVKVYEMQIKSVLAAVVSVWAVICLYCFVNNGWKGAQNFDVRNVLSICDLRCWPFQPYNRLIVS